MKNNIQPKYDLFLSVVFIVKNKANKITKTIKDTNNLLTTLVSDYELIVIDNASDDDSVSILKTLSNASWIQNLQVLILAKSISYDLAAWVGLENSLGDFVVVIDPLIDDIMFLPKMLKKAVHGFDVVLTKNLYCSPKSIFYVIAAAIFNKIYEMINGINLSNDAPQYRVLSRHVVNFVLQHSEPESTYRHLPVTYGFTRSNLFYYFPFICKKKRTLFAHLDRGIDLLLSDNKVPMRIVTFISLFGAAANIGYSIYVVLITIFKDNVSAGWASLSLQQSGMFFLLSLVLFVVSEFVIKNIRLSNHKPLYLINDEFCSKKIVRNKESNVKTIIT